MDTNAVIRLIKRNFDVNTDISFVNEIIDMVGDKEKLIVWFVENFTMHKCPFAMDEDDYEIVERYAKTLED